MVTVKRKTEIGALDRSPAFFVMSETRASKTFANNVSAAQSRCSCRFRRIS